MKRDMAKVVSGAELHETSAISTPADKDEPETRVVFQVQHRARDCIHVMSETEIS
jgi:hypothetical protein